jgi:polysaccharide biosynthesis protein PslH
MHILFLTQVLPYPLDAGPKVRAYYTLRYLATRHDVTLLSFIRPSDSPDAIEHLRSICRAVHTVPMVRSRLADGWHMVRSLANQSPFLIARDWLPAMAEQIRQVIAQTPDIDAVHADQLWMAPYALEAARAANGRQLLTVLDQHNAVFQIPRRLAEQEHNPFKRTLLSLEAKKLADYEQEICRCFDHVAWVTEEDQKALEQQHGRQNGKGSTPPLTAKDRTIPICVDPATTRSIPSVAQPRRVTFLGGMHWPPNAQGILWFANEVWPQILAQAPDSLLTLIGKDPPADLRSSHPTVPAESIELTGYVDDPEPYLAETSVFIVPLHAGGGMRVKILDAWCWGLPIVSTTIGAEGLAARHGDNLLLADTAEDFASAVVSLLNNPDLAKQLSLSGRRTVEQQYTWQHVYQAWDEIYQCRL